MDKLETLISQLDDLEKGYNAQLDISKENQNTILLRLPKVIFIQKVCAYLEDIDLYNLTACCSTLRRVIFCPLGFKLLVISRNANHIIGARPKVLQYEKEDKFDISMLGGESSSQITFDEEEDAIAQLHTLRAVKDFLTMKLKESVLTINKLEDSMDDIIVSLKFEKSVNLKLKSKINILQNQLSTSELQRQDAKENLGELNSKYNKIITQMEQDKLTLNEEKDSLLGHKKILIEEVYRLRDQVKDLNANQQGYKDALNQVKIFMDSVDLKPIQQQLQ